MAVPQVAAGPGVGIAQAAAGDPLRAAAAGPPVVAGLAADDPGAGVLSGQLSLSHPHFARLTGTASLEDVYRAIQSFVVSKMEQNMAHETRMNEYAYNVSGMFQPNPAPGGLPFSALQGAAGAQSYMNRVGGHVAAPGAGADPLSPYRMNSVQVAMLSMLNHHFRTINTLMGLGGGQVVTYEHLATHSVRGTLDLESRFSIAAHWVTTILSIVSEYVAFLWGPSVKLLNAKMENDAGEVLRHAGDVSASFTKGSAGATQAAASKAQNNAGAVL